MWALIIKLDWQTLLAGFAVTLSIISLYLGVRDKRRKEHDQILGALQGEKESVAYISRQLDSQIFRGGKKHRAEIISALANAWMFEKSDRALAMIYSVLKTSSKKAEIKNEITESLDEILFQLDDYITNVYKGEEANRVLKYKNKIDKLKSGLNIDNV